MYSQRFTKILAATASFEGLFQNSATDRANYTRSGKLLGTMRGISTIAYEQYLGREPSLDEIKAITHEIAKDVYYKLFWVPMLGDKLKTDGVSWVIFDSFIATGNLKTARLGINNALGTKVISESSVPFTDFTIKTINDADQNKMVQAIIAANVEQRKTRPNFEENKTGWLARLDTLQTEALKLITTKNGAPIITILFMAAIVWGISKMV